MPKSSQAMIEDEAERRDRETPEGLPGVIETGGVSGKRLKSYIERIERLAEEVKERQDDITDVYAESKAFGFSVPTMKRIIKLRAMDPEKRQEAEMLLETYKASLGMT